MDSGGKESRPVSWQKTVGVDLYRCGGNLTLVAARVRRSRTLSLARRPAGDISPGKTASVGTTQSVINWII